MKQISLRANFCIFTQTQSAKKPTKVKVRDRHGVRLKCQRIVSYTYVCNTHTHRRRQNTWTVQTTNATSWRRTCWNMLCKQQIIFKIDCFNLTKWKKQQELTATLTRRKISEEVVLTWRRNLRGWNYYFNMHNNWGEWNAFYDTYINEWVTVKMYTTSWTNNIWLINKFFCMNEMKNGVHLHSIESHFDFSQYVYIHITLKA